MTDANGSTADDLHLVAEEFGRLVSVARVRIELHIAIDVADTARYAAELWKTDVASVQQRIAENFERLFGLPP